jgi:Cu-Zn family superoxide dismutase
MRPTRLAALAALAAVPLGLLVAALPAGAAAHTVASGHFSLAGPAFTYDEASVPVGASAVVRAVETGSGSTVATLHVRGLPAGTTYAVHAHVGACGASATANGGHYQHVPAGPVDDVNELWLGLTTGGSGNGSAQSVVDWAFRAGGSQSITLHRTPDGKRVGCLDVAF